MQCLIGDFDAWHSLFRNELQIMKVNQELIKIDKDNA